MTWSEKLIQKCYATMETGGEVRIQFSHRRREDRTFCVPIIRSYPSNQLICDEVEIELDD